MESKFHSEDVQNTRSNNEADRTNLQSRVNLSINVFDSDQHPENLLVNVVTGNIIVDHAVNVEEGSPIGQQQLRDFETNLLHWYYNKNNECIRKCLPGWDKKDFKPRAFLRKDSCIDLCKPWLWFWETLAQWVGSFSSFTVL